VLILEAVKRCGLGIFAISITGYVAPVRR